MLRRSMISACFKELLHLGRFTRHLGVDAMSTLFARLKEVQIGGPIWQPLIFAILVILISVTLYFILQM